jgi:hypothetical protein
MKFQLPSYSEPSPLSCLDRQRLEGFTSSELSVGGRCYLRIRWAMTESIYHLHMLAEAERESNAFYDDSDIFSLRLSQRDYRIPQFPRKTK